MKAIVFDMALVWAIAAAVPAVLMEYLYRRLEGPWHHYVLIWTPLCLLISFAICQLIRQPGAVLLDALIVWTLAVLGLRVMVSVGVLGDAIAPGTWAALALVLVARVVQVSWR